jgi:hypothetical protein
LIVVLMLSFGVVAQTTNQPSTDQNRDQVDGAPSSTSPFLPQEGLSFIASRNNFTNLVPLLDAAFGSSSNSGFGSSSSGAGTDNTGDWGNNIGLPTAGGGFSGPGMGYAGFGGNQIVGSPCPVCHPSNRSAAADVVNFAMIQAAITAATEGFGSVFAEFAELGGIQITGFNALGAADGMAVPVAAGPIVYRGLAAGEDPAAGLVARAPGAGNSVASHIAGKRASQWISTTKSLDVALSKYGQNGVVAIDLSKIATPFVDVSGGIPGYSQSIMISRWATNAQEVLILNEVPASAITRLK